MLVADVSAFTNPEPSALQIFVVRLMGFQLAMNRREYLISYRRDNRIMPNQLVMRGRIVCDSRKNSLNFYLRM